MLLPRLACAVALLLGGAVRAAEPDPPNIVIIFTDDQGWLDLGVAGGDHVRTPHLDRMAGEGTRFTNFYVAQPVCSASRAALLTGCYPNRIGIAGALGPRARHGLHADETTIAELCRDRGYATAAFGKWHLGHHAPTTCRRNKASTSISASPTRTTCGPCTPRRRRAPTRRSR